MTATIPAWITSLYKNNDNKQPAWLANHKQQAWDAFMTCGIPARKSERFKYNDFSLLKSNEFLPAVKIEADELEDAINQHRLQRGESILMVLVNGYFMSSLSDMHKLPKEVIIESLHNAVKTHGDLIKAYLPQVEEKYPFANLNFALHQDGLFVYLPKQVELAQPLHILSLTLGEQASITHPQNLFILEDQSKLSVAEEHFSLATHCYITNSVTTFVLKNQSEFNHVKLQHEGHQAIHMAHTFVYQMSDSRASFNNFATGSQFSRDDLVIKLKESGAECQTSGFYHLRNGQAVDHHVDISHQAPRSNSEMLYKGILEHKSSAVFNGRLLVEQGAQKILAYQANHNLLLSKEAEVYSKPELEIYADDVKCKHGATTGQLDQDALFYMRARGILKDEAIGILLQGFAEDIMQRITHPGVKLRIQEMVF